MTEELTSEAKEAMRSYFLRVVAIPGSFLSIILFIMGYLVHDVANSKAESAASNAYAAAMKDTSSRFHHLTIQATEAKKDAESARREVQEILSETQSHNRDAQVLLERIENNEQLSQSINDQGEIARLVTASLQRDPNFMAETKKWPDGKYCIISNGECPVGFTKSEGFMRAISIYPEGDVNSYIRPSTPRLGDMFIQCHGACRQSGQWTGELIVSTCCK